MITRFWFKLQRIFWESPDPLKLLTLVMYPLAAYGLYRAYATSAPDVHWMFHIVRSAPAFCHAIVWGALILYMGLARYIGLFFWEGTRFTQCATPILGVLFWAALLASSLADADHLAFGLLYAVAAAMEMWILSRAWLENT
jgi:hypothetical protein